MLRIDAFYERTYFDLEYRLIELARGLITRSESHETKLQ